MNESDNVVNVKITVYFKNGKHRVLNSQFVNKSKDYIDADESGLVGQFKEIVDAKASSMIIVTSQGIYCYRSDDVMSLSIERVNKE